MLASARLAPFQTADSDIVIGESVSRAHFEADYARLSWPPAAVQSEEETSATSEREKEKKNCKMKYSKE